MSVFSSPLELIDDMRNGRMIILVDDEDRENEGDLVIPAQFATPDMINFMAREGRGLICLAMQGDLIDRLNLPMMTPHNGTVFHTAFTVSIEARHGVTTGISAADRAHTIQTAIRVDVQPHDIVTPGHVFPLRARQGGVLVRAGHTEAAVDLAILAGLRPAGVICEIMNDDGSMARLHDLIPYAQKHGLKIGTIADLIAFRSQTESLVELISSMPFTHSNGEVFDLKVFRDSITGTEHIALIKGTIPAEKPIAVRMHALNLIKDCLGGTENRIQDAVHALENFESGVIVIIRNASDSMMPILPQNQDAALRQYGVGAQILKALGIHEMILLTNTPKSVIGLEGYGLKIMATQEF
jgi:3,4-dihydroxy 2-butanone 4-phosphate synthase/GTP cyclohydrolase II